MISICSDFREAGRRVGTFPAEETGEGGGGKGVAFHAHLGKEGDQPRELLEPHVETCAVPCSGSYCQPQGRDCSLAAMHSGSRRRNSANELSPLPLPWEGRVGQASLSSGCLSSIAISLGGVPGLLTHELGTQEPPEAEAAKLCGMEV